MKTLLALSLAGACGAVVAQTPANNPMPDGSRDMYLGVAASYAPLYLGGAERRVRALPLIQMAWSNGVFVSGLNAGMHLSRRPTFEYGPLLSIHTGRDNDGGSVDAGGVSDAFSSASGRIGGEESELGGLGEARLPVLGMAGMPRVKARLQGGFFANFYLDPTLRFTNSVLYGAGNDRKGLAWSLGLQHTALHITERHRITFGVGATVVNREHNASFFGVTRDEEFSSGFTRYTAGSGVRDLSLNMGWNWALSPAWMVASTVRVTRLRGEARFSPLVERPTSINLATGLAYRF